MILKTSMQQPASMQTFDNLSFKPPIVNNSIKNFDEETITQDAMSTDIVVHSGFPDLIQRFLEHKRAHGSEVEKALYSAEDFTWQHEVSRLISKRAVTFMGHSDFTMLRDRTTMRGSMTAEWDRNGTNDQHLNNHLTLQEYLSYDEIMLSSLIGVSGPSFFINNGNRHNRGKPGVRGSFEPRGIIIGLVGARFERDDRMDSVHVLRSAKQPRQHPELSRIIQDFFGVTKDPDADFDFPMYQARMRITIDILLLEAVERAKQAGKRAYTYVVGLGLGVWQYHADQPEHYVNTCVSALVQLGDKVRHIGTLDFAWITVSPACEQRAVDVGADLGVEVRFTRRNPAEKLDEDELLVLSYAWDGNAFPGNEYWVGSLNGSGDPAAACMSTIGELHNPLINPDFLGRVRVLGEEDGLR